MIPLLFTCQFTGSRMLPQPSVLHVITWGEVCVCVWRGGGVDFLCLGGGACFFAVFLCVFVSVCVFPPPKGTQSRLLF